MCATDGVHRWDDDVLTNLARRADDVRTFFFDRVFHSP